VPSTGADSSAGGSANPPSQLGHYAEGDVCCCGDPGCRGRDSLQPDQPEATPGAKLLAKARGKPLIEWAIGPALEAELDELVVVCGAVDLGVVVPEGATLLRNDDWSLGRPPH